MLWNDLQLTQAINNLDPLRFVSLCNRLLSETAAMNSIPRACITTNLRISEPDGGIDARCINAGRNVGQLIPSSNVIYQFKSGSEDKSAANIAKNDIVEKPRVEAKLKEGMTLVYMAGWDRGDKFSEDVILTVKTKHTLDLTNQFIFLGANDIAHQLAPFPALVADLLKIEFGGAISINKWAQQPDFNNPFQQDDELAKQMDDLRKEIEIPGSRIRIVGSAGDGKTRRILEVLRNSSIQDTVLYAPQFNLIPQPLLNHLAETSDVQCTLVVDKVNEVNEESIFQEFSTMPDGVRLVMIGLDASGRTRPDTIQIKGLNVELLVSTITSIVPGLPQEVARGIANVCEGSPKLAVVIAGRIKDEPSLTNNRQVLADGKVQSVLDRYLGIDEMSPEWQAISVVALLTRLGWTDPVSAESDILFAAAGLNPIESRGHVRKLQERLGIAPLAGHFRYISPTILANHLAARRLPCWTSASLLQLLQKFTNPMLVSFAIRVRNMSHVLGDSREIVEEVILNDDGLFRNLSDLESSGASSLLRHFAAPFPFATLTAMERIMCDATIEELQSVTDTRQNCVWALQVLLWPKDTFVRAASLLLKLALAENKTYENTASRIWTSAFQTQMGRTAADSVLRVEALHEGSQSDDANARKLAAVALGAALKVSHAYRDGGPPKEFEDMPEEAWFPETYGEWSEAILKYLKVLSPLLTDSDSIVCDEACKSFAISLGVVA